MSVFKRTEDDRQSTQPGLSRLAGCGWVLVLLASVTACGGGGSGSESPVAATALISGGDNSSATSANNSPAELPALPNDQEIADRIYQGRDRTPADFYQESVLPSPTSFSTTHIKNTMVASAPPAVPSANVYELCTDDWNQAMAWSEEAAQQMPVYADLTETNGNDRFFEFVRARPDPKWPLERQRVFRCSYLDRSTADLRTYEGPGGTLNRPSPSAADVKELAEYLWQFTWYNNYGNAVLASSSLTANGSLEHTLIIASLVRASTSEACDRIDIVRWIHSVDAVTGAITRRLEPVRSIYARESAGSSTLCSA